MTALDIITLLFVGVAAFRGFSRGFTFELLSLIAWVMAIVAVRVLHSPLSSALTETIGTEGGAAMLALALLFGIPYVIGRLIANRIGASVRNSGLGFVDKALGSVFGALKGLIIMAFLFLMVTLVYDTIYTKRADRPAWMTESHSYSLLNASARALSDFLEKRREGTDFYGNESAYQGNVVD